MTRAEQHLSDQELLLAIDGELSRQRAEQAQKHLASCVLCRERSRKFESTAARFAGLHQEETDSKIPSEATACAALKARMAEAAATPRPSAQWLRLWSRLRLGEPSWAAVCGVVILLAIAIGGMYRESRSGKFEVMVAKSGATPVP